MARSAVEGFREAESGGIEGVAKRTSVTGCTLRSAAGVAVAVDGMYVYIYIYILRIY